MSVSSSLYIGVSGLSTLGEKMTALGDNLANENTTGFRASEVSFENILMETAHKGGVRFTQAGLKSDFSCEGPIESSVIDTHMAITGEGLFILRDQEETDGFYYSRAGEFAFDLEGYMVNPGGKIVQGYAIESDGSEGTTLEDIQIDLTVPDPTLYDPDPAPRLLCSPMASTRLTLITNMDSRSQDHSPIGLFDGWDGTQETPLPLTAYELRADHNVYDSQGDRQSVSIFFDRTPQGDTWEYLITSPPASPGITTDEGVLARGTVTFSANGGIQDMSLENYQGGGWTAATPNTNGYLEFQAPLSGGGIIELDLGTRYVNGLWQAEGQTTTQFGYSSYTRSASTDGYGEGELLGFSVGSDGIIRAQFDNGITSDLFRVGLANFNDPSSHLRRIGYSLFQTVLEEGEFITGIPGSDGLGQVVGRSLEISNVDMAEQFGEIILTQRAFQANAKGVAVSDEMLKTLIDLKR